jgi:transposase-like protein
MTPPAAPERYKHHRFPGEIISHGVWLYYRFPLSYRDVQELLSLNLSEFVATQKPTK